MRQVTAANFVAASTFVVLVGVAYAGADHPPPPGFIIVVALAAVAAWLARTLAGASARRAAGTGAAFGLACALLLIVVSPSDSGLAAALVFGAVLAVGGAVWGLCVYGALWLLTRGRTDSGAQA